MALLERLAALYRWFSRHRYRSWLSHALLAVLMAITPIGVGSVLWAYGFRELGQTLEDVATQLGIHPRRWPGDIDWLDHFGDFAAPFVALVTGAALGWWT